MRLPLLASAALFLLACSDAEVTPDAGDADAGAVDAGGTDAGGLDAGEGADAGLDAGDTWNSYAMGFFQSYCISCHSPTGGNPGDKNFTQYASVVKYSAHIRCGVAPDGGQQPSWNCTESPGQFPIGSGPKPSDPERRRLVDWIDAGMPE